MAWKTMLPWSFSEGAAAEKYMAQLQHNMWVTNARTAALSIITGGANWVEIAIAAAPPAHGREEVLALCPVRRQRLGVAEQVKAKSQAWWRGPTTSSLNFH
jgi:hypothetical protein